ncbi:hypothetical protein B0O99DRAFT_687567 [Bisporella sp. PMI_857]|nr:hypothetical protein B0O99DRAFT_687567 [Bisporella sp. PMI_857]
MGENEALNWAVYRDALIPAKNTRVSKPWERAPMPAHAPRLQGQKIWKRPEIRSRSDEKENETQYELILEGKGARKRVKLGHRENITVPKWTEGKNEAVVAGEAVEEHEVEQHALQYVPRKRTNMDRVITPRKPLGESKVYGLERNEMIVKLNEEMINQPAHKRKSPRKSIRRSTLRSIKEIQAAAEIPVKETALLGTLSSTSHEKILDDMASIQSFPATIVCQEETLTPFRRQFTSCAGRLEAEHVERALAPSERHLSVTKDTEAIIKHTESSARGAVCKNHISPEDVISQHSPQLGTITFSEPLSNQRDQELNCGREHAFNTPRRIALVSLHEEEAANTEDDFVEASDHSVKSLMTPRNNENGGQSSIRQSTRRNTRMTRASLITSDDQIIADSTPKEQDSSYGIETTRVVSVDLVDATDDMQPAPLSESRRRSNTKVLDNSAAAEDNDTMVHTEQSQVLNKTVSIELQSVVDSSETVDAQKYLDITTEQEHTDHISPLKRIVSTGAFFDDPELRTQAPAIRSISVADDLLFNVASPVRSPSAPENGSQLSSTEDLTIELLEDLSPVSTSDEIQSSTTDALSENVERFIPAPSTTSLVETIPKNTSTITYDHDDTDMLRNFLTRVNANKAAKARTESPRRKRSLPHSPLQLPLSNADAASPSPPKAYDEFDIGLPATAVSPSRRRKRSPLTDTEDIEPRSIRRSGRTRLPVSKSSVAAPNFIPVRRLGQDGDTTVTLKRNEEKELAALTRLNTKKNKAGALSVPDLLSKKAKEKDDPALRQRLLKEVFDDKIREGRKKAKTVVWAAQIAQFQEAGQNMTESQKEKERDAKDKETPVTEKKQGTVRIKSSKIALGSLNGTPAPKRRREPRERS